MASNSRRASISIDIDVGNINVPEEPVSIPANLEETGGGGGAGGGGRGMGPWGDIARIFGSGFASQIGVVVRALRSIGPALAQVGGVAAGVLGGVVALAVAIFAQIKAGMFVLRQLGNVAQFAFGLFLDFAQRVAKALTSGVIAGLRLTHSALKQFAGLVTAAFNQAKEALLSFSQSAIKSFADFEQGAANTVTVMGQFGEAGLALRSQLEDAMVELTRSSRYSATQAVSAAYDIASAGFGSIADVMNVTRSAILLGEATLSDVKRSAEFMTGAINIFGLTTERAIDVANMFAAAISNSPATMEKLRAAFQYAGPTAHSFSISIEETTAALEGLFLQGRQGSIAGTELNALLNAMAKGTDRLRKSLSQVGINIAELFPSKVGIVGIVEAFERMRSTLGDMDTLQAIYQGFERRAARGLVALLSVGSAKLREMQGAITGTNIAFQMQQDQLKTLQGAWLRLKNLWFAITREIVQGGLSDALGSATLALWNLLDAASKAGAFKALGVTLGNVAAALLQSLAALGPELYSTVLAVLSQLSQAFYALGQAALQSLPLLISGLQQLPGIVSLAVDVFNNLFPVLADVLLPLFLDFASNILPLLAVAFIDLAQAVGTFLSQAGPSFIAWFKAALLAVAAFFNALAPYIPTLAALAAQLIDFAINALGILVAFLPTIVPLVLALAQAFLALLANTQTLNAFYGLLVAVLGAVQQLGPTFLQALAAGVTFLTQFVAALASYAQPIIYIFQAILAVLKGFFSGFGIEVSSVQDFLGKFVEFIVQNFEPAMNFLIDLFKLGMTMVKGMSFAVWTLGISLQVLGVILGVVGTILSVTLIGIPFAVIGVLELMAKQAKKLAEILHLKGVAEELGKIATSLEGARKKAWDVMGTPARLAGEIVRAGKTLKGSMAIGGMADWATQAAENARQALPGASETLRSQYEGWQQSQQAPAGGQSIPGGQLSPGTITPTSMPTGNYSYNFYFQTNDLDTMQKVANQQFADLNDQHRKAGRIQARPTWV